MTNSYAARYKADEAPAVYPVEFVVRAFLGTYPGLHMPRNDYRGRRALDIGYGDGRNMPLLSNLGMEIHGVEISEDINEHVRVRMDSLGIGVDLRLGTNAHLPYADQFFQYVLACHSCYYVEPGERFADNLAEIARVLEPGGYFIASLPMTSSYILKDAIALPDRHYEITSDPYGLRNGTVFRAFESAQEVEAELTGLFCDLDIGFTDDDFWGIRQKLWVVVCRRRTPRVLA
jgi:SAM-dependent methyltransferase